MRDNNECGPYINHLIAEHRRLHAMLRVARSRLTNAGGPDCDTTFQDVATTLRRLRRELTHHFAEEEDGGCLDEAVSYCPSLSAAARRIEAEHPELLAEIDRLIAQALDCEHNVQNRIAFGKAFDDLCRNLQSHERAENDLLRQGFGVNFNGDENNHSTVTIDS